MAKKDSLSKAAEILGSIDRHKKEAEKQTQEERRNMIFGISQGVVDALKPALNQLASQARLTRGDVEAMVSKIKVETHTPDVVMPEINIPKAEVTVRSPKVNIPDIKMPDKMNIEGFVSLMGVDLGNPLPVQLRTPGGAPVDFSALGGGGGGGGARIVKVSDILDSSGASIIGEDGLLKTSATSTATLDADFGEGEVASKTLRIVQATDAIASVNIVSGSASGTEYNDAGNTELGTGGLIMARDSGGSIYGVRIGAGTSEVSLRTNQATDSIASVAVKEIFGSTVTSLLNGDNRIPVSVETGGSGLTDAELRATSVPVSQVSGANWSVSVTDIANTVAASLVDSSGVQYSGNNPMTAKMAGTSNAVVDVLTSGADGVSNTENELVSAALNYGYNGTSWDRTHNGIGDEAGAIRVVHASDATASTNVVSTVGLTDTELRASSVPVEQVSGSQWSTLARPIQVRDSLGTAYTSLSTGTEATFLAAEAGKFHDLVWVLGANQSDAAVTVDLRMVTAGNVVMSLEIPANSTAGIAPAVPYPQSDSGNNWTVDMPDITGTTVDITGLFSKED